MGEHSWELEEKGKKKNGPPLCVLGKLEEKEKKQEGNEGNRVGVLGREKGWRKNGGREE